MNRQRSNGLLPSCSLTKPCQFLYFYLFKSSVMRSIITLATIILTAQFTFSQSNALDFDGSNDRAEASNASALVGGSAISMSMWIRPTKNGGPFGFAGFRNNSSQDFYLLQLNATTLEARFRNSGGTNYDVVSSSLVLNIWQHFVMTYDGSELSLYRNGSKVDSIAASGTFSGSGGTFYLGALPWSSSYFSLDGRLDDVTLWSKSLSPTEVTCMYNYGVDTSMANLEIYYPFDQAKAGANNSGRDTVVDVMGNANADMLNFSLSGSTSNWVGGYQTHTYTNGNICQGDSFLFGGTYRNSGGRYFTSYSVAGQCDSIVQLDLVVHEADTTSAHHRICEGDSVEFNGQYLKDEGNYSVTLTSQYGCDSTSNLSIDVDTVDTRFTQSGFILAALASGATFQWYNCDGDSIAADTGRIFEFDEHARYAVIVTQNNCTDTSECMYTAVGISKYSKNDILIYPNPANFRLNFEGLFGTSEVKIYDIYSRLHISETMEAHGSIDISQLQTGTYFIHIENEMQIETRKILIE